MSRLELKNANFKFGFGFKEKVPTEIGSFKLKYIQVARKN